MLINLSVCFDLLASIKLQCIADIIIVQKVLHSHISVLDWSILFLYAMLLLGIGWYYSSRQKSKEDYYLGGRSVHPILSGISLYVSFFSAISYLAIAGEVIQYGPVFALAAVVGAPIIYFIASYFIIPFFMNLKIISAYEILERPLGEKRQATWFCALYRYPFFMDGIVNISGFKKP